MLPVFGPLMIETRWGSVFPAYAASLAAISHLDPVPLLEAVHDARQPAG